MNLIYHSSHERPVRVTVLAKIENGTAKFGVSRCSKNDQFVKKTGRTIAEGRASRNPYRQVSVPDGPLSRWFLHNAAEIEDEVIADPQRINKRPSNWTKRVREFVEEFIGI